MAEFGVREWSPLRVRLTVAAVVLGLLLLIGFGARPLWGVIKAWRATGLADQAIEFLEDGALMLAWERSQTAYQLYPFDAKVTRTVALVFDQIDPFKALGFWEETWERSGEVVDLKALIRAAAKVERFDLAERYWQELGEAGVGLGERQYIWGRLLVQQRRIEEAVEVLREALEDPDVPENAAFYYVQVTQFSADPAVRERGRQHLWTLAQRDDQLGLKATRNLERIPNLSEAELRGLISRLRDHRDRTQEDLLAALRLELRLPETDPVANLEKAKALFNLDDPEDLTVFGRWLNAQGRQVQTLEVIRESNALRRQDTLLVYLDALAVLAQWEQIERILALPRIPLEEYLRLVFRARVQFEMGQPRRAELAWSRAVLSVRHEPEKLWFLHDYARRLGLVPQTREVLDRLGQSTVTQRRSLEKRIELEQVEGNSTELREVLARMATEYPDDLSVRNDLAYVDLLLNQNLEQSTRAAEKLVADGSPYLANRVTLALGYLRLGRPVEALEVLAPLEVDWSQARSGYRAVYGAILRANGRVAEANAILADIDTRSLMNEERALLSGR